MASDLERGCYEPITNSQIGQVMHQAPELIALSSEAFARSSKESNISQTEGEGSSYTLASDDSPYVDEARRSNRGTEDTGIQNSRYNRVETENQTATLSPTTSPDSSGMMYIMALLLPLISVNSFDIQWRCTPSAVLRTTELLLVQLTRLVAKVRAHIRRLAHDQIARDLFATAMDIVLVVYAIGFLFLSLYQASIFA